MMSRKHYVMIAGIVKDNTIVVKGSCEFDNCDCVKMLPTLNKVNLINELATMFKSDNINFDKDRFISACYDDNE